MDEVEVEHITITDYLEQADDEVEVIICLDELELNDIMVEIDVCVVDEVDDELDEMVVLHLLLVELDDLESIVA